METTPATVPAQSLSPDTLSALVIKGDLSGLSQPQVIEYYRFFCQRLGLDPATQPFKLLNLQGKKILYCDRGGAAQLCKKHKVSHRITNRIKEDDLYIVTACASISGQTPEGWDDSRQTESIGAVNIAGLKGESLANALMKAETKAKRRATLDLLGLGMLDETETDTIPGASRMALPDPREPAKTDPPVVEAEEDEEGKRMRKARADLNTMLQPVADAKEFTKARGAFQKAWGKDIWEKETTHKPGETFLDVTKEHWARIEQGVKAAQDRAEYGKDLLRRIEACPDQKSFPDLEKEMSESANFADSALHLDALRTRGKELGFNYAEGVG